MDLTIRSFFTNYINHPISGELKPVDIIKALLCSIAIGILTLGTVHFICGRLQARHIRLAKEEHKKVTQAFLSRIQPSPHILKKEESTLPHVNRDTIGQVIQERIINPFYQKPLPPKDQVEVSLPGEAKKRKWVNLSRGQKVEVNNYRTLPHNQVRSLIGKLMINLTFLPGTHKPYLPTDPRHIHGSDHAARMAIFTPVFAYLYAKYHPDVSHISKDDVIFSQIEGAGHDSARQSEGTDVYDDDSANHVVKVLEDLGVKDPSILAQARFAVQHKDFEKKDEFTPWHMKPLVAKLVQNADCAEFARLILSSSVQNDESFEASAQYLDIFKELSQIADNNDGKLKGKLTFAKFQEELKVLRWEINKLIYQTHRKEFRKQASQSGKIYYNEILNQITPEEYPALSRVLELTGVKETEEHMREKAKKERLLTEISAWKIMEKDSISTEKLVQLCEIIKQTGPDEQHAALLKDFTVEIEKRKIAKENFEKLLKSSQTSSEDLMNGFSSLSPLQKEEYRPALNKFFLLPPPPKSNRKAFRLFEIEKAHAELQTLLTGSSSSPKELYSKATAVLTLLKNPTLGARDFHIQTTCALSLQKAALLFVEGKDLGKAKMALDAASNLPVDPKHPLMTFLGASSPLSQPGMVMSFPTNCTCVRKRRLRACERKIDDQTYVELSFELTSKSRQDLEKTLALLSPSQIKTVPASYMSSGAGINRYNPKSTNQTGKDLQIHLSDAVEVCVGANKNVWNEYNLMRVRVKKGTSPQEVQRALSGIGLPTALMSSRAEDKRVEALSRILSFRFPRRMPLGSPDKDPMNVYQNLSPDERAQVDNDLMNMEERVVGPYQIEQVLPTLGEEAKRLGAAALGTFISAGNLEQISKVLANVLRKGLLSSEERYQRGILGLGCVFGLVPYLNSDILIS